MTDRRHEQFESWMQRALELAGQAAQNKEVPVGAIVVLDDRILGEGRNAPIGANDPTAHAEICALRAAGKAAGNYRLSGSILICTVEPCLMCIGAALHARVETIVFGTHDPKVGACNRLKGLYEDGAGFNHRIEIIGGVLKEACREQLTDFFQARR